MAAEAVQLVEYGKSELQLTQVRATLAVRAKQQRISPPNAPILLVNKLTRNHCSFGTGSDAGARVVEESRRAATRQSGGSFSHYKEPRKLDEHTM